MVRHCRGFLLVRADAFLRSPLGRAADVCRRLGRRRSRSVFRALVGGRAGRGEGNAAGYAPTRTMSLVGATTLLALERFEGLKLGARAHRFARAIMRGYIVIQDLNKFRYDVIALESNQQPSIHIH